MSGSGCSSSSSSKRAKRQVTVATFEKWRREQDREHNTLVWLCCDRDRADRLLVSTLWCKVCTDHEDRIVGMRNFSGVWLAGTSNHRVSNIADHARSEQHQAVINCMHTALAKAHNEPVQSYAPVVKALFTTDDREKSWLMKKV